MGQFSWLCSVCGESILSNSTKDNRHMAVLVTPNHGRFIENDYQGYGVFNGLNVYTWLCAHMEDRKPVKEDHPDNENMRQSGIFKYEYNKKIMPRQGIRIIHQDCDRGQTYESLKNSESDPNHGWIEEDEDEWGRQMVKQKRLSYGTWKSKIENFLYNLCTMKLRDFQDYPFYEEEYALGHDPRMVALDILKYYGFKMEFEEN